MSEPTIIERMARALQKTSDGSHVGNWEEQSRAALAAIREPTEAMRCIGCKAKHEGPDDPEDRPFAGTAAIWRAMVDEALGCGASAVSDVNVSERNLAHGGISPSEQGQL